MVDNMGRRIGWFARLASMVALRMEDLLKRTRKQLLALARKLETIGISKLKKTSLWRGFLRPSRRRAWKTIPGTGLEKDVRSDVKVTGGAGPGTVVRETKTRRDGPPREGSLAVEPVAAVVQAPAPAEAEVEPAAKMKLELGPAGRAEAPVEHIPWSYGSGSHHRGGD